MILPCAALQKSPRETLHSSSKVDHSTSAAQSNQETLQPRKLAEDVDNTRVLIRESPQNLLQQSIDWSWDGREEPLLVQTELLGSPSICTVPYFCRKIKWPNLDSKYVRLTSAMLAAATCKQLTVKKGNFTWIQGPIPLTLYLARNTQPLRTPCTCLALLACNVGP